LTFTTWSLQYPKSFHYSFVLLKIISGVWSIYFADECRTVLALEELYKSVPLFADEGEDLPTGDVGVEEEEEDEEKEDGDGEEDEEEEEISADILD